MARGACMRARCDIRDAIDPAGPGPLLALIIPPCWSAMPAQPRVNFDVSDSSSEEDVENPNEPPNDGIPPQGSTAL